MFAQLLVQGIIILVVLGILWWAFGSTIKNYISKNNDDGETIDSLQAKIEDLERKRAELAQTKSEIKVTDSLAEVEKQLATAKTLLAKKEGRRNQ